MLLANANIYPLQCVRGYIYTARAGAEGQGNESYVCTIKVTGYSKCARVVEEPEELIKLVKA